MKYEIWYEVGIYEKNNDYNECVEVLLRTQDEYLALNYEKINGKIKLKQGQILNILIEKVFENDTVEFVNSFNLE